MFGIVLILATAFGNLLQGNDSGGAIKTGAYLNKLFLTDYNYIGDKNAKIVVFDFFDYNCSDCKAIAPVIDKMVETTKKNSSVKFVFIDYPKLGEMSTYAARVAIASSLQDKYIPVHNAMMSHKGNILSKNEVWGMIDKIKNIDIKKLKKDVDSDKVSLMLFNNLLIGTNQSIKYIPTFIIGYTTAPYDAKIISDDAGDGKMLEKNIKEYLQKLKHVKNK